MENAIERLKLANRDAQDAKDRLQVILDFMVQVAENCPNESKWWTMQGMVRDGLDEAIRHLDSCSKYIGLEDSHS